MIAELGRVALMINPILGRRTPRFVFDVQACIFGEILVFPGKMWHSESTKRGHQLASGNELDCVVDNH